MERFVHNANIELYRRLIAESEHDPKRDEDRHKMLQTLLDRGDREGSQAGQLGVCCRTVLPRQALAAGISAESPAQRLSGG